MGQANQCRQNQVCCRVPANSPRNPSGSIKPISKPSRTCGRSQANGIHGRVLSKNTFEKNEADFAEYPWQAAIIEEQGDRTKFICGAVLIDDQHILTATHCIRKYANVFFIY